MNVNEKKQAQLGKPCGTANNILKKNIMFTLAQKCDMDTCCRCHQPITSVDDFTVDHIIPWLDSDNPIELFYDINNIAFSHAYCNSKDCRRPKETKGNSGFRGVCLDANKKGSKKYKAIISLNNKSKNLGWFETAEQAAEAYDFASIEYHGSKSITNKSLGLL